MNFDLISAQFDVSRETFKRLEVYAATLKKWNPKINLVSKNSLEQLWSRHILDSMQVFSVPDDLHKVGHWLDIGSGGGLPGVIVAILAAEKTPELKVSLIESDQRKSAFLRNVARECGISIAVTSDRIELAEPRATDVLSARALADLDQLLAYTERHCSKDGVSIFPKGANWKKEVDNARERWRFDFEAITSLTEPEAVILKIKGVERV